MAIIDELYPQSCPFCAIVEAYPPSSSRTASDNSSPNSHSSHLSSIPDAVNVTKIQPSCFLVLNAPNVLAFLDILPMTRGHLLVIVRAHREKIQDVRSEEGRDVGFWLPMLARTVSFVTGVKDYNLVQNNGARAAQVVPHMHFHIIPRPSTVPQLKNKSWTMFGRGQREELDDDEGEQLAAELRVQLRKELEADDAGGNSKL